MHRNPWNLQVRTVAFMAAVIPFGPLAAAQQPGRLIEPIYRIAHEEPVQETPKVAARIAHAPQPTPFNLIPQPGEHPLAPGLALARQHLAEMDATIKDYSAMLIKQERINGTLHEQEAAYIKVRHNPFSVYMFFLKPNKGQECLYLGGPNGTKGTLFARGAGWKKRFGVMELDPEGSLAMKNQKYPIMKLGMRNLTTELIDVATNDMNFGECEVRNVQSKINGRAVTLLEVTHPTPRANFRFHKAQIFIDNQLHIPIRYASYMWPETPGEAPPLEEAYTYLNVKLNNGFTDADFDKDNPELFKN